MRLPGKTVYDDNRRMEALVRASSLDWTTVRACWLFDAAQTSECHRNAQFDWLAGVRMIACCARHALTESCPRCRG